MRNLSVAIIILFCLLGMVSQSYAAKAGKTTKATHVVKELLVLMPPRVPEEDKSLEGTIETALVEGLQQKYEVFSGEQVSQKAHEIFHKESRSTAKKECDETRCMQDIAGAFQAELIATASVTKSGGGYFIALSIQNIFDNKVVYSKSLTCKGCDQFMMVDRLKDLSGVNNAPSAATIESPVPPASNSIDPENAVWMEVQKGNNKDEYEAYLAQYPHGKYLALAKSRLKKFESELSDAANRREQEAWEAAVKSGTKVSYQGYLDS